MQSWSQVLHVRICTTLCSIAAQHSHIHMYIEISQVDIFFCVTFHYEITHWWLTFALKLPMCCTLQSRLPFLWLACTHHFIDVPTEFHTPVSHYHHLVMTFQTMVSSVSIVTGLWGGWSGSIPDSNRDFSLWNVQTDSGTQSASCSMGMGVLLLGVKLTAHLWGWG